MKEKDIFEDMLEYAEVLPPSIQQEIIKQKELGATCDLNEFQKIIFHEFWINDLMYDSLQEGHSTTYSIEQFITKVLLKGGGFSFFERLGRELNKYEKLYNFQTQSNEFNKEEKLRFLDLFRKIMLLNFKEITDKKTLFMLYRLGRICEVHTLYKNDLFAANHLLGNEPIEHYVERLAQKLGIIQTGISSQANIDLLEIEVQASTQNNSLETQVEQEVKEEINLMEFDSEAKKGKDKIKEN